MLEVHAAGEGHRPDEPVSDPRGIRGGSIEVALRCSGIAAMEADHGGDAKLAAGHPGFLKVLGQYPDFGQRVVPAPRLEEQLGEGTMRLSRPEGRTDLVGEVPGLPGLGQGLLVPVETAQCDGLVDLD